MGHVDGLDDQAGEAATDAGFTLVEVVVALGLLSVVATSALSMFVASMKHADGQRERQVALAVANDAVERIHSVRSTVTSATPQTVAGLEGTGQVGGLSSGRTPSDVATAWNATSFPGKADTRPAWDANTPAGPSPCRCRCRRRSVARRTRRPRSSAPAPWRPPRAGPAPSRAPARWCSGSSSS
ncbi:type II secretion system protein [Quadrisphaera sp. INWT6]|uniref:type II secretion system protein n=1 Tax=Quadrisphaera sp. INWT6 TaxID=2596917 RepID=UPI0018925420|nr:type II secretion system protein [Quadrisphaera sp. INWT6]